MEIHRFFSICDNLKISRLERTMYFEDFKIGQRYELPPVLISRDKILRFAGEFDPLLVHLDDEYAKTTGFGAIIAPGVMSFMAVWNQFIKLNVWGDEIVAGKSTHIEWLAPVYEDETLKGIVTVSCLTERNRYNGIVAVDVDIFNSNGVQVIKNITENILKRRPV